MIVWCLFGSVLEAHAFIVLSTSAGLSFLMVLLAVVALCVSGVYLRASTLHEREIKITVSVTTEGIACLDRQRVTPFFSARCFGTSLSICNKRI